VRTVTAAVLTATAALAVAVAGCSGVPTEASDDSVTSGGAWAAEAEERADANAQLQDSLHGPSGRKDEVYQLAPPRDERGGLCHYGVP